MRKAAWITGVALTLGLAAAGWAAVPDDKAGRAGLRERLDLTSEQEAQWRELHEARRANADQAREQRRKLHEQLHAALTAPSIDEATVRALGRQLGELDAARAREQVERRLAVSKILTPEQRQELVQAREARRERRERRLQRRHERRGGGEAGGR
jgi:protein CpxP